ncbi:MAG: hypothetical protein EG828_12410 [Deltaproteobacteria bacterium]|nr:hypothetical protein [Deltaproteobacteria bacterium]
MAELKKESRIVTVARLFFLLVVIPLLLISSLIAFSIGHYGGVSKTGATLALDQKSQQEIKTRAVDLAQSVGDFLRERQKDVLIATILPQSAAAYKGFLDTKTGDLWVKTAEGIVKEQVPLYVEMSYIDRNGQEIIKVAGGKVLSAGELVNVSNPANTAYKTEDYFQKAKGLDKGQVYIAHVTGWYVNKAEYEQGKRFTGIVRMATPLFDKQGFIGVVSLALDVKHLARYTDNIVPTGSEYVIKADATTGNYAYMVDSKGNVIAHPLDYHIAGLYKDGTVVPAMTPANKDEMVKKGEEVLNLFEIGGIEPALGEIAKEAALGKSGIRSYAFEGRNKMVAYAPIPFYNEDYQKPAGFGWVALGIDVDKFTEQAKVTAQKIEKEGQVWLATIVVILLGAMIILFGIAAILSRGINRSIASDVPPEAMNPPKYDDED